MSNIYDFLVLYITYNPIPMHHVYGLIRAFGTHFYKCLHMQGGQIRVDPAYFTHGNAQFTFELKWVPCLIWNLSTPHFSLKVLINSVFSSHNQSQNIPFHSILTEYQEYSYSKRKLFKKWWKFVMLKNHLGMDWIFTISFWNTLWKREIIEKPSVDSRF